MKQIVTPDRSFVRPTNVFRGALIWQIQTILAATLLMVPAFESVAIDWTGLSGITNGWSDANNWSPAQVPGAFDSVAFTNTGSTNVVGAVNNTVGANITISNLSYTAISNSFAVNTHTTLINPGVTLTVNSANISSNALFVGGDVVNADDYVYATITGAGTLAVGSLASPDTNKDVTISVRILTATGGTRKGVLDMSGLDNFTFGGGRFQVAGNGISAALTGQSQYPGMDRALGSVVLAKTNIITAARPRTIQFPYAPEPFALAVDRYANAGGSLVTMDLGQENTINTDGITLGGARHAQGATMRFRAGLINPTLKLRGADGIRRIASIGIGDDEFPNSSTAAAVGTLDLSIGSVDALVDVMNVGRNNVGLGGTGTLGPGTGTVTLGAGLCDVATLNIGCQGANNASLSTGTVNVRTNAILIAGTINMGRDLGSGAGNARGTLNITGGTVKVFGDIVRNDVPGGGGGTNTITINPDGILDMKPAGDTVPGNIELYTLNIGPGTITNYGTLGVRFINQTTPIEDFIVYPGQALAPIAPGLVGPLAVKTNLTLNDAILRLDLADPGTSDQVIVTNRLTLSGVNTLDINPVNGIISAGTYTLMTYGTFVGGPENLQLSSAFTSSRYSGAIDTNTVPNINLIVSGAASNLIWSGDSNAIANFWNQNNHSNWNGNTEKFFNLDIVTFDDTGATNPPVFLVGTLSPASVTVSSGNNYTFVSSGKISGNCGLTNSGSGTLTIRTTNDYTGPTVISAGTVLVNGKLGNTAVSVGDLATIGGNGTILGTVTVASGGTLAPGASIGTLAISNNLVLSSGSFSLFEANMDTLALDKVVGLSKVTYGGTLNLTLTGRAVVGSDTFKLFSSQVYSGKFASIVPAEPGPSMTWDTSTLTTDGTLRVTSTAGPTLTAQVAGNQLSLSWPPANLGWRLQAQTNSLAVGISNSWADVTGSESNTNLTLTINPANGAVFYRLASPP